MKPEHLVKMANQIGAFFEAMPDREQATRDVASHIARNWEPRMTQALKRHIETEGGEALSQIVLDAVRLHLN